MVGTRSVPPRPASGARSVVAGVLLGSAAIASAAGVGPLARTPDALIGAPQVAAGHVALVMLAHFFAAQLALVLIALGIVRWRAARRADGGASQAP